MNVFEHRLIALVAALRRNPTDQALRHTLTAWIDAHPHAFQAWLPAEVVRFAVTTDEKLERRVQFVRQLLLHGYLPPRIERVSGAAWADAAINVAVVPAYFYPQALSLLEAGRMQPDLAVFVVTPPGSGYEPGIEQQHDTDGVPLVLRHALMLDERGLVWRSFERPVPVHYLFPIDNYYRAKFRLLEEFAGCGVPMPGSIAIREACEDKCQLYSIAGSIDGLRLAREICLKPQHLPEFVQHIAQFCAECAPGELVTKPVDAFGGAGVAFWRYPDELEPLHEHIRAGLIAGGSVLVQERIPPLPTSLGREWNLRQYVLRCGETDFRAAWKRVRIGHGVINTTQGAQSITIEQLLAEMNLSPVAMEALQAALQATDELAIKVLQRLDRYIQAKTVQSRSHVAHAPDLLALDFMIAPHGDTLAIYLNEINDFASGGMRDYEVLAHRQAFPDADAIAAIHPFSLAPAMLELARWRGEGYKHGKPQP